MACVVLVNALRAAGLAVDVQRGYAENTSPTAIAVMVGATAQSEDNTAIYVMNNYFGIGIDADLCLDFHNARQETF